jgi:hypothetical protein
MELSEEQKSSAAVWSPVNRSFLEDPERSADSRSGTYAAIFRDNPLKVMSPQPWPLFADPGAVEALAPVALGIDRLVKSVPERFFANDPERLAAFYGLVGRDLMELIIAEPNGLAGAISRGDYIDSSEGLQCLELNAGSFIGGWQLQALEGLYLGCPPIARFLAKHGLRAHHRNTIRLMFRHIIRETMQSGVWTGGPLNLALIIHPHRPIQVAIHSSDLYGREYRAALAEEREGLQGEVFLCGYADLTEGRDGLSFRGAKVHAAFDQHLGQPEPRSFRYLKQGLLSLYSGPITLLLSDKRNLALLSENATSEDFTAGERDLLQRHIPWTRQISASTTIHRGRRVHLPELLAESREMFVLKKAVSLAGRDIRIGKFLAAAEWQDAVRRALSEQDWIVQEYVESRPYVFLDSQDEAVRHDVIWGLFVFGGTFGGVFLRLQPSTSGGIVNTAGGAEVGLLLEVEPAA